MLKKIIIVAVVVFVAGLTVFYFHNKNKNPAADASIQVTSPKPEQFVRSPLNIVGKAKGNWFFEATFPVSLVDRDGRVVAQGAARATSDWTTADFVPFTTTLAFTPDSSIYGNPGTLILRKDNPSGLPEHDASFDVPILFAK